VGLPAAFLYDSFWLAIASTEDLTDGVLGVAKPVLAQNFA
jgi:hypothetical protein